MPTIDTMANQKTFAGAAAAYCIANLGWWLQPVIINDVMLRFSVLETDGGLAAAAEMVMIAITSLVISRLLAVRSLRSIALFGFCAAILGSILSLVAESYFTLILGRAVAGVGEGALLAVAVGALANFANPDRAYGFLNMIAILFGSAAGYAIPITSELLASDNVLFLTILVCTTALAPFAFLLPSLAVEQPHERPPSHAGGITPSQLFALATSMFLVTATAGAMWSFFYPLGAQSGLNAGEIHTAVALSAVLSVLGALLATAIGARGGRLIPLTFGIIILTLAIFSMSLWHVSLVYRIGAILVVAGTYFVLPFFLGFAAEKDPSGRGVATLASVFLFTGAVGPYLGGYLMQNYTGLAMAGLVILANGIALLIVFYLSKLQNPLSATRDASQSRGIM